MEIKFKIINVFFYKKFSLAMLVSHEKVNSWNGDALYLLPEQSALTRIESSPQDIADHPTVSRSKSFSFASRFTITKIIH